MLHPDGFLQRYQYHQIGAPPPCGQSRHHRLPLVLSFPTSSRWGFFTSSSSHPDWFHSFILWAGSSSPTLFFLFQVWPDLGVKPRLRRSSWRAFSSTHPLIPPMSPREALHALHLFPPWNLPSFTVESTLSSLFSRSDPPLSLHPPWLSSSSWCGTLDWRLCSFSFWQGRLCRTCQMLSLWHWGHSFLFCRPSLFKLFHWSLRHSARSLLVSAAPTSLPFLFSYYLTLVLSSPLCPLLRLSFYLKLSCGSGRNCLLFPPVLSDYNGSLDTRFSRGTTRLMSWPDGERYLRPLQSFVVSLISRVHSCLFSDWRRTVLSKFFDTRVPSISTEELVLPRHARCVLSRLRCNGHSLLLSYLSRIGRIENPSCSACGHSSQDTSHLILHCPATDSAPLALWRLSVSLQPLVQAL